MRDVTAKKSTLVSLPTMARSGAGGAGVVGSLRLAGDLAGFNLADVVQLVIVTKKTGMLSVRAEDQESLLYFEKGCVIHAQDGDRQGEEVAYLFFALRSGRFEFAADVFPETKSLDIDGTFFLMEGMRRIDEVGKDAKPDAGARSDGAVDLSLGGDAARLFGEGAGADAFGVAGEGGPKLSLIKNETVLELDLYRGVDDGSDQNMSFSDELVEALLAQSPGEQPGDQLDVEEDGVALELARVEWLASYNIFSQNGYPLTGQAGQGLSHLGEQGVATVSILEFSGGLGGLLEAGELEYATITGHDNSKTILTDVAGRYVSAKLKPGSPSKKLITKMLDGLTLASSR